MADMELKFKKVAIGSDHAGKELKQMVLEFLKVSEVEVVDFGVALETNTSVDYPDYASAVSEAITAGKVEAGILICGTGIGMSIVANKYPGIRAALTWDEYTAKMCREHNDANIICIGARTVNHHRAIDMVRAFLNTEFGGNRHGLRLAKIRELEKKNFLVE